FSLVLSIVFFFNAPSTAQIYTLSLHDALPILYKQDKWTWDAWLDMARATTKITPEGEWQVGGCNPHLVRCWLAANGGAEFDSYRDRKSTRLNSSHRTISYAVFCLKKKKKNTTT